MARYKLWTELKLLIIGAWVVSAALWSPGIIGWQHITGNRTVPENECYIQACYEPFKYNLSPPLPRQTWAYWKEAFRETLLFSDNYRMCLETSDASIINILFTKQPAITSSIQFFDGVATKYRSVPFICQPKNLTLKLSDSMTKMTNLDRSWLFRQHCTLVQFGRSPCFVGTIMAHERMMIELCLDILSGGLPGKRKVSL